MSKYIDIDDIKVGMHITMDGEDDRVFEVLSIGNYTFYLREWVEPEHAGHPICRELMRNKCVHDWVEVKDEVKWEDVEVGAIIKRREGQAEYILLCKGTTRIFIREPITGNEMTVHPEHTASGWEVHSAIGGVWKPIAKEYS